MPASTAKIATWSNNSYLQSLFVKSSYIESLDFVDYKNTLATPYVLIAVDLSQDLSDISQRIISIYDHCRRSNQKLSLVIFHGETVDTEKNHYFSQLLDQLGESSPLHRLVFVKDIYHEDLMDSETWLEKYLLESLMNKKIVVSAKGENLVYPLTIRDFIFGLQKAMFLSGTAGKTFWLVGDPLTDLDLGYLIKKYLEDTDKNFEIEATARNRSEIDLNSLGNQTRVVLNWEPIDDFSLELKEAVKRVGEDTALLLSNLHRLDNISKHPKRFKTLAIWESLKKIFFRFKIERAEKNKIENAKELFTKVLETTGASIALIYLLVTLSFVVCTSISLSSLESSLFNLRNGNIPNSVGNLKISMIFGKIGESSYSFIAPVFSFLATDFHEKNHNLFVFLRYSQSSLENLQQTYLLAEKVYQSVGNPTIEINYSDAGLALRSNLSQVYENINQIRLLTDTGKLPDVLENRLQDSPEFKNISLIEDQVTQLLKSAELVPAFLGGDTAKNIIFVFQNSNELRSTGGTVDYLLALVLDHGRLVSKRIYTASEIDDLLSEKVPAPPLIGLYTGSENWKVRDLNYNPDFSTTAQNFSAVIEKSLKIRPDIIIAVNERLIIDFLAEDKGILLNGQSITADTFKEDLPKYSPSPLYNQLIDYYLDKIFKHGLSLSSLGRVIAKQSLENQMFFWTSDNNIEKTIVDQNFAGVIFPHNCPPSISGSAPCLSETTYLSESNFSLVSVGNGLQKRIVHKITFTEKGIAHQYLVDYGFAREFPGLNRDLNEIVQLYAPAGSALDSVQVNGKNLSPNTIQKQFDNRLERFQIPLSLKFNSDNRVVISFLSPYKETLRLPFAYALTEYRQPGLATGDGNIELVLNVPSIARAALITAPATSTPTGYDFLYPPKTATFGISFEPKER